MSFGFDNVSLGSDKKYLRQAGLNRNAKFLGLTYGATEEYEYFDIELEASDGKYFRERTFGPDINKIYPKGIYKNNSRVGEETKEEALERMKKEINTKLFHLALCFATKEEITDQISTVGTLKELVDAVAKVIGKPTQNINFLTVWKNSDTRRKSNLIIAERIKWCEPFTDGREAGIRLTQWQLNNQTTEKYPYAGSNESTGTEDTIVNNQEIPSVTNDLPF